jgi:hypothetical protein
MSPHKEWVAIFAVMMLTGAIIVAAMYALIILTR